MKIGDKYQGGIVYKVDGTGEHGGIVTEKKIGRQPWGNAMMICKTYKNEMEGKTYDDWELPSITELLIIRECQVELWNWWRKGGKKPAINFSGTFWSSSQASPTAYYDLWFNRYDIRKPGITSPAEHGSIVATRKF